MQTLKAFFEIDSETKFNEFEIIYGNTPYGKLLLDSYGNATIDVSLLDSLQKEEKFMIRLTDEERIKEQKKGIEIGEKEKAIEIAQKMISLNINLRTIADVTGLSEKEIETLYAS